MIGANAFAIPDGEYDRPQKSNIGRFGGISGSIAEMNLLFR